MSLSLAPLDPVRMADPDPAAADPAADPLWAVIESVCDSQGVELVHARMMTQRGRRVLRVLIDREPPPGGDTTVPGSGVTLADCTAVSREIGAVLEDRDDLVPGAYELEVGSPGVERPLHRRRDFERFAGKEVRVATRTPIDGRRRFTGRLLGVDGAEVRVDVEGVGDEIRIPLDAISKANLVFRF
jgi:ribosome maturation factor RimP